MTQGCDSEVEDTQHEGLSKSVTGSSVSEVDGIKVLSLKSKTRSSVLEVDERKYSL